MRHGGFLKRNHATWRKTHETYPIHFRSVESIVKKKVHSAVIVPFPNAKERASAVAAVCLVNKRGGGQFGEEDERVASTCLR